MFHAVSKDHDSDAVSANGNHALKLNLKYTWILQIIYVDPDDSNGDKESESNEVVEEPADDDGRAQQLDSPENHPLSQGNNYDIKWLND